MIAAATNYDGSNAAGNLKLIGEKRRIIAISEEVMAVVDHFRGDLCRAIDVIELSLRDGSFVVRELAVEILLTNDRLPCDDELMSVIFESRNKLRIPQRLQDRICALESSRTEQ